MVLCRKWRLLLIILLIAGPCRHLTRVSFIDGRQSFTSFVFEMISHNVSTKEMHLVYSFWIIVIYCTTAATIAIKSCNMLLYYCNCAVITTEAKNILIRNFYRRCEEKVGYPLKINYYCPLCTHMQGNVHSSDRVSGYSWDEKELPLSFLTQIMDPSSPGLLTQ